MAALSIDENATLIDFLNLSLETSNYYHEKYTETEEELSNNIKNGNIAPLTQDRLINLKSHIILHLYISFIINTDFFFMMYDYDDKLDDFNNIFNHIINNFGIKQSYHQMFPVSRYTDIHGNQKSTILDVFDYHFDNLQNYGYTKQMNTFTPPPTDNAMPVDGAGGGGGGGGGGDADGDDDEDRDIIANIDFLPTQHLEEVKTFFTNLIGYELFQFPPGNILNSHLEEEIKHKNKQGTYIIESEALNSNIDSINELTIKRENKLKAQEEINKGKRRDEREANRTARATGNFNIKAKTKTDKREEEQLRRTKSIDEKRRRSRLKLKYPMTINFNGGAIKKIRKTRKSKPKRNKTKNRKKKSKSKRKTKK